MTQSTETITWIEATPCHMPAQGEDVQGWDRYGNWTPSMHWRDGNWWEYTANAGLGPGWRKINPQPIYWADKPRGPKA